MSRYSVEKPKLEFAVDAVVALKGADLPEYFLQLRSECAPAVRRLQTNRTIAWFSFLIHDCSSAGRTDLPSDFPQPFIHFRFTPADDVTQAELIQQLGSPFLHPIAATLGAIGGIDGAAIPGGWRDAWWMIGMASDWVLTFAEVHRHDVPTLVPQIVHFLHYITNGFFIGGRSIFIPTGFQQF